MTNGLIAPRLGGFLLREIVMQRAPARMTGDVNTPLCVRTWPPDSLPRNTKQNGENKRWHRSESAPVGVRCKAKKIGSTIRG